MASFVQRTQVPQVRFSGEHYQWPRKYFREEGETFLLAGVVLLLALYTLGLYIKTLGQGRFCGFKKI